MRAEVLIEAGVEAGRRLSLGPGERAVLGRGEDAQVPLRDEACSRHHAALSVGAQGLEVTDLGSKNGTHVGGRRLPADTPTPLRDGDVVELGAHRLRVLSAGPAAPRVRDEFQRLGELGRGGYGVVFSAQHMATGRLVAIKALTQRLDDAVARERFLRETRVRVDSPYIVQTLDVRVEDGQAYLIMELVQGRSLEAHLREAPLPIALALRVGEQVARGLAAAHDRGIVHRDVKPANILLEAATGLAKLADFGVAKVTGEGSLTSSGQGMGTLVYCAPEQAADAKRVSPVSDLYALGATLYHAIAGRPPFLPGPQLVQQLFEDDPTPLHRLRPDCPADVSAFVHRLLEKEPADRPARALLVAERLRERREQRFPGA